MIKTITDMKGHDVTEIVNQFNNNSITLDEMWDKVFTEINKTSTK